MKAATGLAAVLPAMLLAAVLTAVAGTAWANDGFLPPLPGADAGEAAEDARAAPIRPPDRMRSRTR